MQRGYAGAEPCFQEHPWKPAEAVASQEIVYKPVFVITF